MQVKTFWPRCAPSACDRPTVVVGLAFAQRRRRDGGHIDVLAVRAFGQPFAHIQMHLGFVGAEEFQIGWLQADFFGDLQNGLELAGLRDVDVAGDGHQEFQLGGGELHDFLGSFGVLAGRRFRFGLGLATFALARTGLAVFTAMVMLLDMWNLGRGGSLRLIQLILVYPTCQERSPKVANVIRPEDRRHSVTRSQCDAVPA